MPGPVVRLSTVATVPVKPHPQRLWGARIKGGLAVFVLVAFILSGCVGEDQVPDGPQGEGDQNGARDETKQETGSIKGQVVQENREPVEGARVVLTTGQQEVAENKTDRNGVYLFQGTTPGTYRVIITAACCMQAMNEVRVEAGETIESNVVLADTPRERGYVERKEWTGFIECAVHVAGAGGQNHLCDDVSPNADRIHQFTVTEGLRTVVIGIDWDPELTTVPGSLTFRFYRGDDWTMDTYEVMSGSPPLNRTIGPERGGDNAFLNIEDEWTLSFQAWSQGGGLLSVSYQQQFNVWYDLYYWEEAPEGASAFPE